MGDLPLASDLNAYERARRRIVQALGVAAVLVGNSQSAFAAERAS